MTVKVRDLRPEDPADVAAYVQARRAAMPYMLISPDSVVHELATAPAGRAARLLVAEANGRDGLPETVGTAEVGLAHDSPAPGQGYVNTFVRPDRTALGAGAALLRHAEEHLVRNGATVSYAWAAQDDRSLAFAARHGYSRSRSAHFLHLDLAGAALPALPAPAGTRVVAACELDDLRPLFLLDTEVTADEPGDVSTCWETGEEQFHEWLLHTWHHPLTDPGLTTVALVEGHPAAFTLARTDGDGRYGSGMTGTARAHRGQGLAGLVKTDSLRRARVAGLREALTGNDAGNTPMLAVNRRCGYRIRATEVRHVRPLS